MKKLSKEILKLQISDSLKCSSKYSEKGKISFKLLDANGDELSIEELVNRYFSNPKDYFIYKNERKEKTRQDGIENAKYDNKKQKNNTRREDLEEHISRVKNDDKLHIVSENNENNIQNSHQLFSPGKEQIEHSKSTAEHQFLEGNNPEYIYGNEDDEEHEAIVDDNL